MSAFDRYIFRKTFGAFLLILISLTTVIWLTHALREIDLMTNQKQTVLTFIGITGLLIPMLMMVIAPIALVVAVGHTLNQLNTDSEIVVMNASGMSPWRIFRPFLMTTMVVAVMVFGISAYLAPKGLRELRNWATKVKADFVINIVQPGRFMTAERGLTIHIRERRADGRGARPDGGRWDIRFHHEHAFGILARGQWRMACAAPHNRAGNQPTQSGRHCV